MVWYIFKFCMQLANPTIHYMVYINEQLLCFLMSIVHLLLGGKWFIFVINSGSKKMYFGLQKMAYQKIFALVQHMVHGEEKRLPYFVHKPLSTFHIRWRTEKKYKCFIRIFRITSLGGRYVTMSKMWTSIKMVSHSQLQN